jgi:hypothetical protein
MVEDEGSVSVIPGSLQANDVTKGRVYETN